MKILEVGDFNRPDRRVKFAMKGEVPRGWEEDYSRLPEVGERVCLYSTDDVVPFGCLAPCTAVDESETGDGRSILIERSADLTFVGSRHAGWLEPRFASGSAKI